jgi:hypothetical protein
MALRSQDSTTYSSTPASLPMSFSSFRTRSINMLQGAELLRMALKEDSTETLKRNYPNISIKN